MCEYSCVCVESPRNPSQPIDILGHDLDWLASKATASGRGEENRGQERERENKAFGIWQGLYEEAEEGQSANYDKSR